MEKILNIQYGTVHGMYWMGYGVISSFASAFLLARGYSNSEIGLIFAVSNVLAVFLQPVLADVADRSKKISMIDVCKIGAVIMAVLMAGTYMLTVSSAALSVVYVLLIAGFMCLQPLLNSMCFYLEKCGVHINFGITRSGGSLAYAILCSVLGTVVEAHGVQVLPVTGTVIMVMFLLSLIVVARQFKKGCRQAGIEIHEENDKEDAQTEDINLMQFLSHNKIFFIMTIGVLGVYFSNSIMNSFMLQIIEPLGGTEEEMGQIFGLLAFMEIPTLIFFDRINRRFSCQTLIKVASVAYILKNLVTYFAPSVTVILLSQGLQLFSFALFLPAMVQFISEVMREGEAVKGQALYTAMTTVATVLASLLGGWILDFSGAKMMLIAATIVTTAGTVIIWYTVDRI